MADAVPNLNCLPAEIINIIVDHLQGQTVFACISPTAKDTSNDSPTHLGLKGTLRLEDARSLPDAFSTEVDVMSTERSVGPMDMLTGGPNIYVMLPHHYRNCMGVANGRWADANLNHPDHPGSCGLQNSSIFGGNTTTGSNGTVTVGGMCHYLSPNSAFCRKHQVYHNINHLSAIDLPEWQVLSSYYNSLRALCLTSWRLNGLCMPRLYHGFVEEDHAISGGVQGRRLLLLLRTLIGNPGRGALIKNVTASTWLNLDTDCLTEDDMKKIFEQTGRLATAYPWQVDIPFNPFDQKPTCLWQENPPDAPCKVQCLSVELLQSHVYAEHISQLQSSNICRWSGCSRLGEKGRFFWKSQLKAHLCSHIGLTIASCPLCKQQCNSLQAVDVHFKDYHSLHELVRGEREVDDEVAFPEVSDQMEKKPPYFSRLESARSLQAWAIHDSSHPLSDFPFCSALAWSHGIRRGEWDAIFSFFLSYLPSLESLTIQDPDAGSRCPFSQCYYLTTFMRRAALSQLRRSHSISIRGSASHLGNKKGKHEITTSLNHPQPPASRKRKLSFLDELRGSDNKHHKADRCTIEAISCSVSNSQKSNIKRPAVKESAFVSLDKRLDKDVMERAQDLRPAHAPLLPHLRNVTLDCMYRSGDVQFADVLPFVSPPSVETLSCSYLVDDHGTALKAARLGLKTIAITNGQLTAASVADLIKACPLLESFSFEVGGACEIAYQTLASVDVKKALDRAVGTLEHLDLMKSDMNYWRPDYAVTRLEGHTGFTFDSFRNFKRLKRLYLKAETMVRHSKGDPDADTGPLWEKLPASLEELRLAGNEIYFANLLPEIQELLLHKVEALPRLQKIAMSWREEGDESESPQNWADTLVILFGKENSIDESQGSVAHFLARVLKNMEPKSDG